MLVERSSSLYKQYIILWLTAYWHVITCSPKTFLAHFFKVINIHTMKVFQLKAFPWTTSSLIQARDMSWRGLLENKTKKYKLVFSYVLGLRQTDKYFIAAPQRSPLLPRRKTLWGAITSSWWTQSFHFQDLL